MCFGQARIADATPAPNRASVADAARRMKPAPGILGNIFTSALGDASYGSSIAKLAALGGARK